MILVHVTALFKLNKKIDKKISPGLKKNVGLVYLLLGNEILQGRRTVEEVMTWRAAGMLLATPIIFGSVI